MSTDRTLRLTPQQLAIKHATDEAVRAAGGQVFVGREVGRSQGRMSDYCSENTADFMPVDLVVTVEALGAGAPGHPHITRALARAAGQTTFDGDTPPNCADWHLGQWFAEIAGEHADFMRSLASGEFLPGQAADSLRAMPAQRRAAIARELDQLIDVLAGFNTLLHPDRGR